LKNSSGKRFSMSACKMSGFFSRLLGETHRPKTALTNGF